MQEFPLNGWNPGDWIFYRTTVEIPQRIRNQKESLVFHSFYLWAKHYDVFFNGELSASGRTGGLNVDIAPKLIASGDPLEIAIRVDPGDSTWQGISHFGAVAIGTKHGFSAVNKVLSEVVTERPYWGLIPRTTICLLFCFIFFVYDNRRKVLWFIAFVFLNALSYFVYTDYAMQLLPGVDYAPWVSSIEILSWWALLQYFVYLFEYPITTRLQWLNGVFVTGLVVLCGLGLFSLPVTLSASIFERTNTWMIVAVHFVGLSLGLWRRNRAVGQQDAQKIACLVVVILCAAVLLAQLLEAIGVMTSVAGPFEVTYGLVLFLAMTFATVTDLGRTVRQKRAFELEVQRQAEELARAEVDRAIARTSLMIAHDLRKPFSMIRMLTRSMREGENKEIKVNELSKKAESAASQIEGMLQDLLSIRNGESGDREVIRLSEILSSVIDQTKEMHRDRQIEIELKLSESVFLSAHPLQIHRLFTNLLNNAFEAQVGGRVWVHSGEFGKKVKIFVGNSGSYLPEQLHEKVFDMFYTENKPGGTGIGLAACKSIVENHGGTIVCRSSKEMGTEFVVELPTEASLAVSKKPIPSVASSQPVVALIDDDIFIQSMWKESLSDADLVVYSSPEACLEDVKNTDRAISMFVTDFGFGSTTMNGAKFAEQLRKVRSDARIFSSSDSRLQPRLHKDQFDGILEKRVYSYEELVRL